MPKHEAGSAKAIGNRQKSIGLQKLRWYCQMCQKQCRDENGFKCHTQSESHLRQMRIFAENPDNILDEFSKEFERGFLEVLSHRHGTKRMAANKVYSEYIGDKNHIHMNATIWTTLTAFCIYLGKESKAVVDETEKGWFIQFIDRDPKVLARQLEAEKRQKHEVDDAERNRRYIAEQIRLAEEREGPAGDNDGTNEEDHGLDREASGVEGKDGKIAVTLVRASLKKRPIKSISSFAESEEDDDNFTANDGNEKNEQQRNDEEHGTTTTTTTVGGVGSSKPVGVALCAAGRLIQEAEKSKKVKLGDDYQTNVALAGSTVNTTTSRETSSVCATKSSPSSSASGVNKSFASNSKDADYNSSHHEKVGTCRSGWFYRGLYIKVISKSLADGKYYKQYGTLTKIYDNNTSALVELDIDDSGEDFVGNGGKSSIVTIEVQQGDVQTVVPKVGRCGMIVRGEMRGTLCEVDRIHVDKYNCDVYVTDRDSCMYKQIVRNVEYEDICKYVYSPKR